MFGIGSVERERTSIGCASPLEVMRALSAGEIVDYDGRYHQLHGTRQEPRPLRRIPILIGGIGPKTLALVREFADWWNVHVGQIHKIEELRPKVGDARVSIQQTVALIGRGHDREAVTALATRRFGWVAAAHRHGIPSWSTPTEPSPRTRHRAGVHLVLRLRTARDARRVRRRCHRAAPR